MSWREGFRRLTVVLSILGTVATLVFFHIVLAPSPFEPTRLLTPEGKPLPFEPFCERPTATTDGLVTKEWMLELLDGAECEEKWQKYRQSSENATQAYHHPVYWKNIAIAIGACVLYLIAICTTFRVIAWVVTGFVSGP